MPITSFPPVDQADEHGLLAIGGDLSLESLLLAYTSGIFPWPISEEYPMAWFAPDPRGVIFTDKLHIPRSLKKFLKKEPFTITYNQQFREVVDKCSEIKNRKDQDSTWISEEIKAAYFELFKNGFAYSVECLNKNDELVGGLYGVCIGKFYSGESMFYREDNASKAILVDLIQKLKENDIELLDTQMVTSVIESLGGEEIPRDEYMKILKRTLSEN